MVMTAQDFQTKEQIVELSLMAEIKRIYQKAATRIMEIAKAHKGEKDFSWDKYPQLKKKALEILREARMEVEAAMRKASAAVVKLAAQMNEELYDIPTEEDEADEYNEELYGKTFRERLGRYSNSYLIEMALIIAAGVSVTFSFVPGASAKVLSLGKKLPGIGRGDAGSSVKNIQRLAMDVARRIYHQTYFRAWEKAGVRGYEIFRGSDYDCPICNTLPGKVYPMTKMILPAHPRCVCYAVIVN